MRWFAAIIVAACVAGTAVAPAQAAIRLLNAKCPVKADAAFRVVGARGEIDGVRSEYQWLARARPGWHSDGQALIQDGNRLYDLLLISKGRQKQVICFDITAFFGKMG